MPTTFRTSYRPSVHGFRFDNDFNNLSVGPLQFWGRCNGMAQVSVDYFRAGRPAPSISVVDQGVQPVSGVAAALAGADRVDIYTRRHGDRVAIKSMPLNGAPPTHWQTILGGEIAGTPAVAMWSPARRDIVVRGKDSCVRHGWLDGDRWPAERPCGGRSGYPEDLSGPFDSSPAVAAPFADRLEVYARHQDGSLRFKYYGSAGWSGWSSLGSPDGITLTSDPAAASRYGWMTAVVRGSDGGFWQKEWSGGRWQPWRSIGGRFTSAPALATPFPGRLEAYGRGLDGGICIAIWTQERGWGRWDPLGAPPPGLSEDPPAAVGFYGGMLVFARANDETVWMRRWRDGAWQPWTSVEVPINDAARRLNDAIYARLIATTHGPLAAALLTGVGLAFVGSVKNFITLRPYGNDQLFHWASVDEVSKLVTFLSRGLPVPLSLLDAGGGWGHEVVAYGLDIGVPLPGSNLAGDKTFIHVYDPNHPGCDSNTIALDPHDRSIRSSSGEVWRAAWVRDDYQPLAPPV